jgi:hypothetical protein
VSALRVAAKDLRYALRIARPFVPRVDFNPSFQSVRLSEQRGRLLVEATDRFAAVVVRLPGDCEPPVGFSVVLPWRDLWRFTKRQPASWTILVQQDGELVHVDVVPVSPEPGPRPGGPVAMTMMTQTRFADVCGMVARAVAAPEAPCHGFPARAAKQLADLAGFSGRLRVYPRAENQPFVAHGLPMEVVGVFATTPPPDTSSALLDTIAAATDDGALSVVTLSDPAATEVSA